MRSILCQSVNRLSKAQKNQSRCVNLVRLTLAVHCLHEGGLRNKSLQHKRRGNEEEEEKKIFLSTTMSAIY